MRTLYYAEMESPVGTVSVLSSERGLAAVDLHAGEGGGSAPAGGSGGQRAPDSPSPYFKKMRERFPDADLLVDASRNRAVLVQLGEYFKGIRTEFIIELDLEGTDFQKRVWKAVSEVPYGETRSYKEIAKRIGNPGAVRAVGQANRANPVPLVIPCHRIIGSDGSMTGYGGPKGIPVKKRLLEMERSVKDRRHSP